MIAIRPFRGNVETDVDLGVGKGDHRTKLMPSLRNGVRSPHRPVGPLGISPSYVSRNDVVMFISSFAL